MQAVIVCGLVAVLASGCGAYPKYRLYRQSPYKAGLRVYFATFDAQDFEGRVDGNLVNCQLAAAALEAGSKATDGPRAVRFWCERTGT